MNNNWALIDSFLKERSFAQMQVDSFNQFIDNKLDEIVNENKEIEPKIEEVKLELSKIEILKPRIVEADGSPRTDFFPMEARTRNRTYAGPLYLTIRMLRRDVEQDLKRTYVGDLPIMLKSNRCWLNGLTEEELVEIGEDPMDFGGYFIINGSEKALMTQEVLSPDRVLVSREEDKQIAEVISTKGAFKGRVRIIRTQDGALEVSFPASPRKLKLFILLKALGLKRTSDIIEAFSEDPQVKNDVLLNLEDLEIKTEEEALDKIGNSVAPGQVIEYRLRRAQEVIDAFLLPHIGQLPEHRLAKAYYLAMMAEKAVELAYGLRNEDDKDHYANKRLELSGKLMEHLFRYSFKYFIKDLKFQIDRTITRRRKLNISTVVRPGAITERIRFAMATGNWIGRATGVSKFMDRKNYLAPLKDLRTVKSPLDKNRELYEARDVHGTHWGRLCCIETPDGPQCVAPETEMLMADYSFMPIKNFENLWKKEKILSADVNKDREIKEADVVRFIKMDADKRVFRLRTKETGRGITVTEDHPFFTENGKKEIRDIKEGERVLTLPIKALPFEEAKDNVIIDEERFRAGCPEKSDSDYLIKELKEKGLLPLKSNDRRLLIIARLLGHLFGDGSLTCTLKKYKSDCRIAFSGSTEDLEAIAEDVKRLGFNISDEAQLERESVLTNGRIIKGISKLRYCYAKPLWVLFKALGCLVGDKALVESRVPDWITKERAIVIKEFLSAYFGSEMTTPKTQENESTFLQATYSLNKKEELVENGIAFAEEINRLLELFDIKCKQIKIVDGIERKSGIITKKIKVLFAADSDNLINLYGKIGFNYAKNKTRLARNVVAYLTAKQLVLEKRKELNKQAVTLMADGKENNEIMKELRNEIKEHDIANWRKSFNKKETPKFRLSDTEFTTFKEWIKEHEASREGLQWETVESIEEAADGEVIDITTLQGYHNFFANGFLTGNCGLTRNLSLMAEITTDTSEEPVEKIVKEMGVKLK